MMSKVVDAPKTGFAKLVDWVTPHKKYVYYFNEGSNREKELLGNKGSNLCEMYRLGLPVPHGFILSTDSCRDFYKQPRLDLTNELVSEYEKGIHWLEKQTGRTFGELSVSKGNESLPLLVSIRSGAAVSMPGMMDTVLNLGMNEQMVLGMAKVSNNLKWAYDTYRRFLQMFGTVVLQVDKERYEKILQEAKERRGVQHDSMLTDMDLMRVAREFRAITDVPDNPWMQLRMAIKAVILSWNSPRAMKYRDINNIPADIGTAVVIQSMVYGNLNDISGTGVAFTRNPATGANEFYGEYLPNAAGEEVVAGIRTPMTLKDLQQQQSSVYLALMEMRNTLELHFRDVQDIEFTVQNGVLYVLETRNAKRTAEASVKIAVDMVNERMITEREALLRLDAKVMDYFLHPMINTDYVLTHREEMRDRTLSTGLGASSGAACGAIAFNNEEAIRLAKEGKKVILCRNISTADDISGLEVSNGLLTVRGGLTAPGAVTMRSMGKAAVTGAHTLCIDEDTQTLNVKGKKVALHTGDMITIDGTHGTVYVGELPTATAGYQHHFQTILSWAEKYKSMQIFANADNVADVRKALSLGAEGIGLCRTEHMFFHPDRINFFRKIMLTDVKEDRARYLHQLAAHQRQDFLHIFRQLHNRQVSIRLFDAALQEALPKPTQSDFTKQIDELSSELQISSDTLRSRIFALQESNPMLGCRGCRLEILYPEIVEMQSKAIMGAAIDAKQEGYRVHVQVMLPMIVSDHEVDTISPMIVQAMEEMCTACDVLPEDIHCELGTMIETPRACIRADRIASSRHVNSLTIGTNELTQMIFGMSHDDASVFMPTYLSKHIIARDPFLSIDHHGVGSMMRLAIHRAKNNSPNIRIGVCGEHGGDPTSISFFQKEGIDSISCSPYHIPIAKIAAAQAHIEEIALREELDRLEAAAILF